jgi:branched-chain amino acid transport system permease protein
MLTFIQTLVDGLMLGGVFALSAAGFSLVFGVLHVLNLSHGMLTIVGAYLALTLSDALQVDPLLVLPLVMIVTGGLGYAYQRLLVQRVLDATGMGSMLLTLGVAMMAQNVLTWTYSPDVRALTPAWSFASARLGELRFDLVRLGALAVSLVLLCCLSVLLQRTTSGRQIRATAQQGLAARLCGVDVPHVYALAFAIASAFAGAAGVVIGLILPFTPSSDATWTLNAFMVVTLGGVAGPMGALIGGLLLGVIYTMAGQFVGPAYANAVMFLILVGTLVLRPHGILGHSFKASR